MKERHAQIIEAFDNGNRRLREVGEMFGITRERVRQILAKHGVTERRAWHTVTEKKQPWTQADYERRSIENFWSKVNVKDNPDECWEWTGAITNGYPRFSAYHTLGNAGYAHHWAYIFTYGQYDGWLVRTCRNLSCCNPKHIAPTTPSESAKMRDANMSPERLANRQQKFHRRGKSKYEPLFGQITQMLKDGARMSVVERQLGISNLSALVKRHSLKGE